MNKSFAALLALVALASGAVVYGVMVMTGPDMRVQPALMAYDARMPLLPKDAVPAVPGLFFPSERPGANTSEYGQTTLVRGKFAYVAYCVFCHGERGDGEAPVGQSYAPGPGDLRTERVRALDDAALLRASLTGVGHDPVLSRVVPPGDRPSLLLYVRALAEGREPGPAGADRVSP
uniref:Cytochrome c domain-containing protein n=1 Tax=Desulfovibrio sp. U5L TaxID=596152 RepID=I2Q384_9BACT